MRYFELDTKETKILDDFEGKKLKRVKDAQKETTRYEQYAKHTLSKTRNINIRLSDKDLQKIKALAIKKGLPY